MGLSLYFRKVLLAYQWQILLTSGSLKKSENEIYGHISNADRILQLGNGL